METYRYVIFLNEGRTEMLTCWPQPLGKWSLERASRDVTWETWGPPTRSAFTGSLGELAAAHPHLPVRELVI